MSNELHDDEALFSGFDSLVPPLAASLRAVEQTRRLLLEPINPSEAVLTDGAGNSSGRGSPVPQTPLPATDVKPPVRMPAFARYGLAAAVLLVAVLGMRFVVTRKPGDQIVMRKDSPQKRSPQGQKAGNDPIEVEPTPRFQWKGVPQTAAWVVPHMHAISAERAPVMVANGGKEPIRLGSATREGGGSLHVWDWSKSPVSRVLPDVVFWGTEKVALSPDGNHLVWARGDILNLQTGEKGRIDLGDDENEEAVGAKSRICDLRFTPDGGRLAVYVMNLETEPGVPGARILSEVVRVIAFPTGRQLCEFPVRRDYLLRIGFSVDGGQIATADSAGQIVRRDLTTGNLLQRYDPAMTGQVMGVAISPDGKHVAAVQREPGVLFIWEADSGRLTHRIDGGDPQKRGGYDPHYGVLRFSPDSKYLAAELGRLVVFDVTTGEAVATLGVFTPTNIQWSADGERVTAVSAVVASGDRTTGDQTSGGREDRYPEVTTWDWRHTRRIPALYASPR